MVNNRNPLLSRAEWCRYRINLQLSALNLNHFKVVESMGLKVVFCNGITSLQNFSQIYQLFQ
jgi:hypothetical protein